MWRCMDELDLLAADLQRPKKRFSLASRVTKKPEPVKQPSTRIANTVAGARSDGELKQYLSENAADKVLVVFGSTWCHSCHAVFPHLYRLTAQFPGLKYVIAQIDYMQEGAKGVEYTPTFRFLDKGKTVDEFFGDNQERLRDRIWLHAD